MKEEINLRNQVNNDTTPIGSLSSTNLDIEVEEGRVDVYKRQGYGM